jgi:hypothetical protein
MAGTVRGALHEAQANQTATMWHFSGFWAKEPNHRKAIGMALANLANTLRHDLSKPGVMELYVATLSDLSPQECVLAFSRAAEQTERWFPTPGQLRRYAGRCEAAEGPGQSEAEVRAREALGVVLNAMRLHGLELKAIPGKLLRDRDDEGHCIKPEYGPETPAPEFGPQIERTLAALGYGSRKAGLVLLAGHPAVTVGLSDGPEWGARVRTAIERQWVIAYLQESASAA